MGVPSQGYEWWGAHTASVPPPEAVGLGAGTCGPHHRVEVGDAGAERCARRGHIPVPVLSPPHPSRPGAGLPVAMAAPPHGQRCHGDGSPLWELGTAAAAPPPRWGQDGAAGGGPTPRAAVGWGWGLEAAAGPSSPPPPFPCAWCSPSGGALWGPTACGGWTWCGGCKGSGLGAEGGQGAGAALPLGQVWVGGFGVGVGGFSQIHGVSAPARPVGAGVLLHGVPGAGQAGGSQQGDRLSPPGGRAASPPPVSPLLPCLAPSHVSPASPRWR